MGLEVAAAEGSTGDFTALQERETETLALLDSVDSVLQKQADLGQALCKGWMGLASVRYSAGPHALDHFIGCALSGKKAAQASQMRLFFDSDSELWRVRASSGVVHEGASKAVPVPGGGGGGGVEVRDSAPVTQGREAEDTRAGRKVHGFYGPPALRRSGEDFQEALALIADVLNASVTLANALKA